MTSIPYKTCFQPITTYLKKMFWEAQIRQISWILLKKRLKLSQIRQISIQCKTYSLLTSKFRKIRTVSGNSDDASTIHYKSIVIIKK
jgi:hypothetical protein